MRNAQPIQCRHSGLTTDVDAYRYRTFCASSQSAFIPCSLYVYPTFGGESRRRSLCNPTLLQRRLAEPSEHDLHHIYRYIILIVAVIKSNMIKAFTSFFPLHAPYRPCTLIVSSAVHSPVSGL